MKAALPTRKRWGGGMTLVNRPSHAGWQANRAPNGSGVIGRLVYWPYTFWTIFVCAKDFLNKGTTSWESIIFWQSPLRHSEIPSMLSPTAPDSGNRGGGGSQGVGVRSRRARKARQKRRLAASSLRAGIRAGKRIPAVPFVQANHTPISASEKERCARGWSSASISRAAPGPTATRA
jgi:hypothetical protein